MNRRKKVSAFAIPCQAWERVGLFLILFALIFLSGCKSSKKVISLLDQELDKQINASPSFPTLEREDEAESEAVVGLKDTINYLCPRLKKDNYVLDALSYLS